MNEITNPRTIARRKAVKKFAKRIGVPVHIAKIKFDNLRKETRSRLIKLEMRV